MMTRGTAPTEQEMREELGLPASAEFKGWVVHTPHEDGFLVSQTEVRDALVRAFGGSPEAAMFFPTAEAAGEVAADLDYTATVAAVFDVGSQLAVIQIGGNAHSEFGK